MAKVRGCLSVLLLQRASMTSANGCFGLVRYQVAPGDLMMTSQWATRPGEYPDIAYPHLS